MIGEKSIQMTKNDSTLARYIDSTDLYNNEILGCVSLYAVIAESTSPFSPAKVMLILPFAMHNSLVSYLNDSRTKVASIRQLLIKKTEFFSNFNARFYSLLDISVNSLLILFKLELVLFDVNGNIVAKTDTDEYLNLLSKERILGKRAINIINASATIANLLVNADSKGLYHDLRVEI